MEQNSFPFMMRRGVDDKSIKEAMNIAQDLKTMFHQYNKFASKKGFPEIEFDCFVNTDGMLITKINVNNEQTQETVEKLQKDCKSNFDNLIKVQSEYKDLTNKYEQDKKQWLGEAQLRQKEWDMIRTLTKTTTYDTYDMAVTEEKLREQIYHELRREYGLEE